MLTREKNKISHMHFILSVLVILIHSINNETKLEKLFSIDRGIGQFAVPLFFIISGYLFFVNVKTIKDAVDKLRRRVYTLLIPYLLWNLIYYAIHLFLKPGSGISMNELIDAAFTYKYNPAFWFMYQLILLSIISPLIYYVVNLKLNNVFRKVNTLAMAILLCVIVEIIVILGFDIPYINEDALIYYLFGVILSLLYNNNKFYVISKKSIIKYLIIFVFAYIFNRCIYRFLESNYNYVNLFTSTIILVRLFGAMIMFYIFDLFISYQDVPVFMKNTFFLYAIHYMIVKAMIIFMRYFMYKFLPVGIVIYGQDLYTIIECIVFIMSPVVCVLINYYLSRFLIRRFKKQYDILVGNRR